MLRPCWLGNLRSARPRRAAKPLRVRQRRQLGLYVEQLEDRLTPSGGYLLLDDLDHHSVLRYDESSGEFVDVFVPRHSGGLSAPYGMLFGPHDHNLYVASGYNSNSGASQISGILRYDDTSGAFIDEFAESGKVVQPRGIIFGPDGNLYVANKPEVGQGAVVRFNGTTGAFMDTFIPNGAGGLSGAGALVFGPSIENPTKLDLYVASWATHKILRFDGSTGGLSW